RHSSTPLRDCADRESNHVREATPGRAVGCRRLQNAGIRLLDLRDASGDAARTTAPGETGGHARFPSSSSASASTCAADASAVPGRAALSAPPATTVVIWLKGGRLSRVVAGS